MLDCQPVHEQATQSQSTVLVVTSGTVKFDGNRQHYFNQNFLLTAQVSHNSTVWKIASDCFRFKIGLMVKRAKVNYLGPLGPATEVYLNSLISLYKCHKLVCSETKIL